MSDNFIEEYQRALEKMRADRRKGLFGFAYKLDDFINNLIWKDSNNRQKIKGGAESDNTNLIRNIIFVIIILMVIFFFIPGIN